MPTVRYFAAAAEAAGRESEILMGGTIGELRAAMIDLHGLDLERVLNRCAVLVGGLRGDEGTEVDVDSVVDVLPPFAGG